MGDAYFYTALGTATNQPQLELVFDQMIPWPAITWKRTRVVARGTRAGITVRLINDKKYNQAKANLGWEIKAAAPKLRCSNTDRFGFRVVFHLLAHRGGDGDRYENMVMDALQGIVWQDDNQVDEGQWLKKYGAATPGIWLTIWKFR